MCCAAIASGTTNGADAEGAAAAGLAGTEGAGVAVAALAVAEGAAAVALEATAAAGLGLSSHAELLAAATRIPRSRTTAEPESRVFLIRSCLLQLARCRHAARRVETAATA